MGDVNSIRVGPVRIKQKINSLVQEHNATGRMHRGGIGKHMRAHAGASGNTLDAIQPARINTPPQSITAKITAVTAINGLIRWMYTVRIGHWNMAVSPSTGGAWVEDVSVD